MHGKVILTVRELLLLEVFRRPSLNKEKDVIWVSGKFCVNSLPCIKIFTNRFELES